MGRHRLDETSLFAVMARLVPAISSGTVLRLMAGTSLAMTAKATRELGWVSGWRSAAISTLLRDLVGQRKSLTLRSGMPDSGGGGRSCEIGEP